MSATDEILRRGSLLAPVPATAPECTRCTAALADGTDGLCAPCRDAAPATLVEMARELDCWIPAASFLPEAFTEVLANDGTHVWPAFVNLDGRWYWGPTRPLPDGHVVEWRPMPIPTAQQK